MFTEIKINVLDEAESRAVQRILLLAGNRWVGGNKTSVQNTTEKYLYIDDVGDIRHGALAGFFVKSDYEEYRLSGGKLVKKGGLGMFKNIKIRVADGRQSAEVQQYLIGLGARWGGDGFGFVRYTDMRFLFLDERGVFSYSNSEDFFSDHEYKEMKPSYELSLTPVKKEVFEYKGTKYFVQDIEKALRNITPVEVE